MKKLRFSTVILYKSFRGIILTSLRSSQRRSLVWLLLKRSTQFVKPVTRL